MSALYCRSTSIEMAPLQDETILFSPEKKQFCVLNRTASLIWNQLATPSAIDSLASKLCQSFSGVSSETALRDTESAVRQMLELKFIVDSSVR